MAEFDAGTEIAGYRIESVIGRGGMAVVYRAEDTRLGRKVALKLLTPSLAENEQFQQRFIRESRLAASLDHPNIVPIYEAGESEGHLFIAMRFVPGSDLKALLSRDGRLAPARVLRLFVQIGDALDAAHLLGLVHRDVKPGNILITSLAEHSGHAHPDHVYLTDFGLTKRTSSLSGSLTGTGHFLGTVDYVSPEQIQGAPVGPATDIYALGCVLYECLTGRLPFSRDDDAAVLWAHLVEMPPPVTAFRPDLPPEVDDVVARAMAKAPEDRYDSCRDLVRDLEYALNASVEVGGASHAQGRPGARHSASAYPVDDATTTSEQARAGRGAPPAAPPEQSPDSGETRGWVSHPSLPPGAITPPWRPGAVPVGPDPGGPAPPTESAAGDAAGLDEIDELDEIDVLEPDDLQGGEEPPWEDEEEEEAPVEPVRRKGRWMAILAAAVAVAVIAGIAAYFVRSRAEEPFRTFANRETLVPYSLSYPQSWKTRTGAASDVVISPRPDAVGDTFLQDAADQWGATRRLLASSPADARGVYLYAAASGSDTSADALRSAITLLMRNAVLDFGPTHRQLQIGGASAHEFEGVLSDPQAPGTRLHAIFDLVLPPGGGSVLIGFFAAPEDFEAQRAVFNRIRDGVSFPG